MNGLDAVIGVLGRFNKSALECGRFIGWTLLAIMTAIVLIQVVCRYGFDFSLAWAEESARYMMLWLAFSVAPLGYRLGMNVSIRTLANLLKGSWHYVLELVLNLLVTGLMGVMIWRSYGMLKRGMKMTAVSFDIPMIFIYVIVPISFALMFLVSLEIILKAIKGMIDPSSGHSVYGTPDVQPDQAIEGEAVL